MHDAAAAKLNCATGVDPCNCTLATLRDTKNEKNFRVTRFGIRTLTPGLLG